MEPETRPRSWVIVDRPKVIINRPMDVEGLETTPINKMVIDDDDEKKKAGDDNGREREGTELRKEEDIKYIGKELEKEINELKKELLILKKEKVKEEQRRLMSEAGVPKVSLILQILNCLTNVYFLVCSYLSSLVIFKVFVCPNLWRIQKK